ncbi:hypothetical protein ILUMI_19579, partial [Ignelater luminosus]
FESARGHKMERDLYVSDILGNKESNTTFSYNRDEIKTATNSSFYGDSHRSSSDRKMLSERSSLEYDRLKRLYHPYQQRSPLDGCYSGNGLRYSDRNIFYPRYNNRN